MIEKHEILRQLGEGSFSKVFLARHKVSNFPVALKQIKINELDKRSVDATYNEICLLQKVDSANVIRCYEAFLGSQHLYISLEYADDGDLQNWIIRQYELGVLFSERTIWYYFHQICKGLLSLHDERILHRDLKPANVFLTSDGRAKLGDLGLSRIFSMKTKLAKTAHTGTAYYMAPERYSSTAGYHFGSDIWSLGCILYEMATLRSPFAGEQSSEYALQKRITTGEILPIATDYYSRYLDLFIFSCLSIKPESRPDAKDAHSAAFKMHRRFEELRLIHKNKHGCSK